MPLAAADPKSDDPKSGDPKSELRRQALDRRREVDAATRARAERAAGRRRPRMGAALAAARRRRLLADPRRARCADRCSPPCRRTGSRLRCRSSAAARRRSPSAYGGPGEPLARGALGVPEPGAAAAIVEPDLLFVPLAAFDRRGHRIGYGAGYYDRALKRLRASGPIRAVGVAYSVCGDRRRAGRAARRTARFHPHRARVDRRARPRLMRLLFIGDIVGRTGRTALLNRLPASARALAARFRRRQRRERRRRLRHHRGDLRGVPRRRGRRDHARQPRLRPARSAGVHRAPAAPDPPGQLLRRARRGAAPICSRPRAARECWSST